MVLQDDMQTQACQLGFMKLDRNQYMGRCEMRGERLT